MVNSQFVFFDESSTSTVSNVFINNSMSDALIIQVDDLDAASSLTYDLLVEGAVDVNRPNTFFGLKVISMTTLEVVDSIASAGIYMIGITGINKIRITANAGSGTAALGTFKVYAVGVQ